MLAMGKIVLVTGGSRSGKSEYAQKAVEAMPGSRAFIATCPVIDDEMQLRIRNHQDARHGRGWHTIEEPLRIEMAVRNAHGFACLVVDCLTLWINNLMYQADTAGKTISEADISVRCHDLLAACTLHPGTIVFVTNEVGMGIVPENPVSRLYRDLVGRCNQVVAGASHRVVLLISGQAIEIKREEPL
jgi:adenosylcobinamide kinase / adenosylcobinamide-phosphate guanylyltransferase